MGACVSSPQQGKGEGGPEGSVRGGVPRRTGELPVPWDLTIRNGDSFPPAAEEADRSVRAGLRLFGTLDDAQQSEFASTQASAKDEHERLSAYVQRGAAAAAAAEAAGSGSSPLRGTEGWLDNDAAPQVIHSYTGVAGVARVHAATVAGTRAGGGRPNQDAFGCSPAVGPSDAPLLLAAVYDGHGPQGHFISRHVRDRLPAWITSCCAEDGVEPAAPGLAATPEEAAIPEEEEALDAQPISVRLSAGSAAFELAHARSAGPSSPPPALRKCPGGLLPPGTPVWVAPAARAFLQLDADLCTGRSALLSASKVSAQQSGSTAVLALVAAGFALIASAGDSAAFVALESPGRRSWSFGAEGRRKDRPVPQPRPTYTAVQLTGPHKPVGSEATRVRAAGGRVACHPNEPHIARVWPRPEDLADGAASFGLAVSRAFGDSHWKKAGVCASPDVTLLPLQPAHAFLLLCSDGITDVLSGQEAVMVAAEALHSEGSSEANAAAAVNAAALAAWATRFPTHPRDDCTSIVVMLTRAPAAG